jgi:transcriptional regulator with XRE-family HTH domain
LKARLYLEENVQDEIGQTLSDQFTKKKEVITMRFDELFEQRSLVASKLKECIRDMGYTKISFARKTDISRPTLDKLLNESINSKSTFDRHLKKILKILNISVDELILYHPVSAKTVTAVCSQNAPVDYKMSDKAKKQYDLLLDVIDLCTIYY